MRDEKIKKFIEISEDRKQVRYLHQKETYNYSTPEQQVQVEAYLKLILQYGYKPERIRVEVPVKMGRETKKADMVVYKDDECTQPHIIVECKKQEVSEQEFLQSIEQVYSYAYAMPNDVKYIWVTSGLKDEYFEVDKSRSIRITLPDIPQYGVNNVKSYKYVYDAKGLKNESGTQQYFDLETISEEELTRQFKQAHNALWAGGQLNPSEAFDELDKLIFCKIWDERKHRYRGEPYDFQIITISREDIEDPIKRRVKENEELADRVHNLYEQGRIKDPEVFRDTIRLSPEKIRTVVGYLQKINLGETDLDAKGRAFETFMDSFFRGNFGQYFTPRPIVKFTTNVLPITNEKKILDTSCGSGGFLLYALNKVRKQANKLYPDYRTDPFQKLRHYNFWHEFAEKKLFGIEINEQISRAAKMNMIIHDDGHTNVITLDGLLHPDIIKEKTTNKKFIYGDFDIIITNPPFGSAVKLTEKAYMRTYKFGQSDVSWLDTKNSAVKNRDTQSTEVLFIEQAHNYLKEGGYLGIVIPDGILTNSSMQYVRNQIEDWFRIVAVVSIPQIAFVATGAGVKSSILFLKKWSENQTKEIIRQKAILQDTIKLENNYLKRVEKIEKEKKDIIRFHKGFINTTGERERKAIEGTTEFKNWKTEITSEFNQKIADLKEELTDIYQLKKNQTLANYPIFMAIAEDIGYDAAAKQTGCNELDTIEPELENFINAIENKQI